MELSLTRNIFLMIEVIVRTNWETLTEFRSLPTFFPPDKSGGYAQATLTEFFYRNRNMGIKSSTLIHIFNVFISG